MQRITFHTVPDSGRDTPVYHAYYAREVTRVFGLDCRTW